ncbi:MAG: hypothetical protein SFW35_13090 [Chitinophagales bacterium]|nr:hypothetical protein [Chitinophagales bacterium]
MLGKFSYLRLRFAFALISFLGVVGIIIIALVAWYRIEHEHDFDKAFAVAFYWQPYIKYFSNTIFVFGLISALLLQYLHGKSIFFVYNFLLYAFMNNLNYFWLGGQIQQFNDEHFGAPNFGISAVQGMAHLVWHLFITLSFGLACYGFYRLRLASVKS